jgi:hypothetical protein
VGDIVSWLGATIRVPSSHSRFFSFYFHIHTLAYHNCHALVLDCQIPIIRNFAEVIYGCIFGIYLTIVPKTILIIWLSLDIFRENFRNIKVNYFISFLIIPSFLANFPNIVGWMQGMVAHFWCHNGVFSFG